MLQEIKSTVMAMVCQAEYTGYISIFSVLGDLFCFDMIQKILYGAHGISYGYMLFSALLRQKGLIGACSADSQTISGD